MTYIYILSDYEEHGAENVTATLDRSRLLGMVEENWPFRKGSREQHDDWIMRAKAGLEKHLQKTDKELVSTRDGWNCHDGWGGMQLHVVKLV